MLHIGNYARNWLQKAGGAVTPLDRAVPMTAARNTPGADEKAPEDRDAQSSDDRWKYHSPDGDAFVHTEGGIVGAAADVHGIESKVETYFLNGRETVNLNIIVGGDDTDSDMISTGIELTPEQTEALARDLFEQASVARENRGEDDDD